MKSMAVTILYFLMLKFYELVWRPCRWIVDVMVVPIVWAVRWIPGLMVTAASMTWWAWWCWDVPGIRTDHCVLVFILVLAHSPALLWLAIRFFTYTFGEPKEKWRPDFDVRWLRGVPGAAAWMLRRFPATISMTLLAIPLIWLDLVGAPHWTVGLTSPHPRFHWTVSMERARVQRYRHAEQYEDHEWIARDGSMELGPTVQKTRWTIEATTLDTALNPEVNRPLDRPFGWVVVATNLPDPYRWSGPRAFLTRADAEVRSNELVERIPRDIEATRRSLGWIARTPWIPFYRAVDLESVYGWQTSDSSDAPTILVSIVLASLWFCSIVWTVSTGRVDATLWREIVAALYRFFARNVRLARAIQRGEETFPWIESKPKPRHRKPRGRR